MASLKPRWTWAWDNTTGGFSPIGDDKDKRSIFSQMPPLECSIEAAEPRQDFAVPCFACWPILPLKFECFVPMLRITSTYLFVRLGFLCLCILFHYRVHCRFGSATGPCARCGPDIEYRITSQDTAPYTCPDVPGSSGREFQSSALQNYSYGKNRTSESSVAQYGSVLQFVGRQCGYDAWFELATPFLSLTQKKAN